MGTVYMLTWPLYPKEDSRGAARWLCASVPALAGLQFLLVGLGLLIDPKLVASATVSPGSLILYSACLPPVCTCTPAPCRHMAAVAVSQLCRPPVCGLPVFQSCICRACVLGSPRCMQRRMRVLWRKSI